MQTRYPHLRTKTTQTRKVSHPPYVMRSSKETPSKDCSYLKSRRPTWQQTSTRKLNPPTFIFFVNRQHIMCMPLTSHSCINVTNITVNNMKPFRITLEVFTRFTNQIVMPMRFLEKGLKTQSSFYKRVTE